MEVILNLILKAGIALLILYLFYYALLRKETTFRFNRLYLLLAPLVALSLPLLKWPALFSPDTAIAQTLQAIQLTEVTVVAYRQPMDVALLQFMTPVNLAWSLYLLVALFLAFRLCRQLWHIQCLIANAATTAQTSCNVRVFQIKEHYASFAFLNYVFLTKQEQLSPREKQQVLAHELAHVQLGHTYDVLFYELISIVLWFNPVIWFLKNELRNVHEFQADARVLEQHQPQEYSALLSKEVLFNMGLPIGSYFQKPQVLQRLHMLKQHGKQHNQLKPLLTLPLLLLLLFSLTSQRVAADIATQLAPPAQKVQLNSSSSVTGRPGATQPTQQGLQALAPAATDATKATTAPAQTGKMPVLKGDSTANMPVRKSSTTDDMPNSYKDRAYTFVEEMPVFIGGEAEMMKFLGQNIRYPKEAQEANVQGLVVLSFTVEEDGSLSGFRVIKKLGMGTDEEALRVARLMNGKWLPGKQSGERVRVEYTLPIRFAIK